MGAGSEVAGRWGLDRSRESWAGRGLLDCARVAVRSDLRRLALGRATDRMALRVCPAGTGARPRASAPDAHAVAGSSCAPSLGTRPAQQAEPVFLKGYVCLTLIKAICIK